ncbi:MAG: PepSY domain-containing protein [Bacteroidota bacterium]
MLSKVWRTAHLALAVVASIFLLLVTISGAILAFEPIKETIASSDVKCDLSSITLSEFIHNLNSEFEELYEITIDDYGRVMIAGEHSELEGSSHWIIKPTDGSVFRPVVEPSAFFSFVTNFHRSLFLKTPGRLFVGITSFLLILIAITGLLLLIRKLGRGILGSFVRTQKYQYYHSYFGRVSFIPILIIAITGVILSFIRFDVLDLEGEKNSKPLEIVVPEFEYIYQIPLFQNITLDRIEKVEFPFSDDEEDFFTINLDDKSIEIHQKNGQIVTQLNYPFSKRIARWSMQLHTGAGVGFIWAGILFLSSISIFYFMYSGFIISYRRLANGLTSKGDLNSAEIVLLVGSENGMTRSFAKAFYGALTAGGARVLMEDLNNYKAYPKMQHLIVMTSTYGDGEAPGNADKFLDLLASEDSNTAKYSIVGFGSTLYPRYCQFALDVKKALANQKQFTEIVSTELIDRNDLSAFEKWVDRYSEKSKVRLDITEWIDKYLRPKRHTFTIIDKKTVYDGNSEYFTLLLHYKDKIPLQSGDLLAIKPSEESNPRLYSISYLKGRKILLYIKLHKKGLCSQYLYNCQIGDSINGSIRSNHHFHLPAKKSVALIANGTGIAPFIGMFKDRTENLKPLELLWGVRTKSTYNIFRKEIEISLDQGVLHTVDITLSREGNRFKYVHEIIRTKSLYYRDFLDKGGVLMICGSITMKNDIMKELVAIFSSGRIDQFIRQGQILSDCY